MTSLPVPLSPVMMTLLSLRLTTFTKSKIARMRGLWPTTISSRENCPGTLMASFSWCSRGPTPARSRAAVRSAAALGAPAPFRLPVSVVRSLDCELFELLDLISEGHLDAHVERHVCARATRAHAGQPHARAVAVDFHQLDVSAVRLHHRPDAIQHAFDPFTRNHDCLDLRFHRLASMPSTDGNPEGNGCATRIGGDRSVLLRISRRYGGCFPGPGEFHRPGWGILRVTSISIPPCRGRTFPRGSGSGPDSARAARRPWSGSRPCAAAPAPPAHARASRD